MQPCSTEMGGMAGACLNAGGEMGLPEMQSSGHGGGQFDPGAAQHDDFFDQMLSTIPSWPDYGVANAKSPWDLPSSAAGAGHKLFGLSPSEDDASAAGEGIPYGSQHPAVFDESALLASRLRQHQISGGGGGGGGKAVALQLSQHQMFLQSLGRCAGGSEPGQFPLPLCGGAPPPDDVDATFNSSTSGGAEGIYNGFRGSQQHFHHPPEQGFAGAPHPAAAPPNQGGAAAAPPRQRVRARRGQATDPHSIAERLRRERIAERMKALQELVPNANKTDKASMLDEIIDYVKFLQLQVKVLSMSRLGGAGAVTPVVTDFASSDGQAMRGNGTGTSGSDNITVTEHQVAKLMEEDMGSAMQYLQGKGLCLMPISLASAISTATGHPRSTSVPAQAAGPSPHANAMGLTQAALASAGNNPSSPSVSVLTVQSAVAANDGSSSTRDAASVSKP